MFFNASFRVRAVCLAAAFIFSFTRAYAEDDTISCGKQNVMYPPYSV